jgi:hypothetical protein
MLSFELLRSKHVCAVHSKGDNNAVLLPSFHLNEKRIGIGYNPNFATWGAWLLIAALLVIVGAIIGIVAGIRSRM